MAIGEELPQYLHFVSGDSWEWISGAPAADRPATAQGGWIPWLERVDTCLQYALEKLAACEARIAALEAPAKRDEPKVESSDSVAVTASRKQWSRGALPFEDMGR